MNWQKVYIVNVGCVQEYSACSCLEQESTVIRLKNKLIEGWITSNTSRVMMMNVIKIISQGGGWPDSYLIKFFRLSNSTITYGLCTILTAAHNSCTTSVEISTDRWRGPQLSSGLPDLERGTTCFRIIKQSQLSGGLTSPWEGNTPASGYIHRYEGAHSSRVA